MGYSMKRIVQYMVIAVCVPMSLMISIATLYSHDVQMNFGNIFSNINNVDARNVYEAKNQLPLPMTNGMEREHVNMMKNNTAKIHDFSDSSKLHSAGVNNVPSKSTQISSKERSNVTKPQTTKQTRPDDLKEQNHHSMPNKTNKTDQMNSDKSHKIKDYPGCQVPKLSLETDSIGYIFNQNGTLECDQPELFVLKDSKLLINKTVLGEGELLFCVYHAIIEVDDKTWKVSRALVRQKHFEMKVKDEFFRVQCASNITSELAVKLRNITLDDITSKEGTLDDVFIEDEGSEGGIFWEIDIFPHDQFFMQTIRKPDVLKRKTTSSELSKMNVLVICLDSMSHLNYQRKLPKTYSYLKDTLGAVMLNAFNVVADGTLHNIVPLLTGHRYSEIRQDGTSFDNFPFIWTAAREKGYVTMYSEDFSATATFAMHGKVFRTKPVDFYGRAFWQAMDSLSLGIHLWTTRGGKRINNMCYYGQKKHEFSLNYARDMFVKYPDMPKFSFILHNQLSHNVVYGHYADKELQEMLELMYTNSYLDNTLLIVMGDHGMRIGPARLTEQGRLEQSLPLMSLTFPKNFQMNNPQKMRNLRNNADKLTTAFDIHETLRTIMGFPEDNITRAFDSVHLEHHKRRNMNILGELPSNRTCEELNIPTHLCTCHDYQSSEAKHSTIIAAANVILENINTRNGEAPGKCAHVTLKRIIKSSAMEETKQGTSDSGTVSVKHYQVVIETGHGAMFDTMVRHTPRNDTLMVDGDISRINLYRDQPKCIVATHPDLRPFCYCH